ncbi:serine/threonine-protein kinase [Polyangium sp. 6x1]|uniref:WD40 repeat domain-containing serine/threonine protein kinase n=1 Tax=Polyangium sp. 6x1 TaxID=3042689 RepID=UPI002482507F|nr:serine/threonine-protein kinase [Polyangium sp. 6x1]MDI1447144.1 protein kinase [Polyangium sp. 6x1]
MPPAQGGQHLTSTLRLIRRLGAGAMGTVWAAEEIGLGRQVAVKVMSPGYANDDPSKERFRKEAQAAARIRSPYVATIFGHGVTDDGQPFITMELLDGETLRDRLRRLGPLPIEEVVRLFGQMARGLAAAHKMGVVHRDIKPANLFVIDDEGEPFVKVLDFGIAKDLDASSELTSTGAMLGTPAYMSPEQYDDTKRVDHRTDLWSLGIVAYEALTGKTPFTGSSLPAMAFSIARGEFQPPSALRQDLPRTLDGWMARALSLDVEARFGSTMEMAETLAAATKPPAGRAGTTSPPTTAPDLAYAETKPSSPEKPQIPPPSKPVSGKVGDLFKAAPKRPTNALAQDLPQAGEGPRLDIVEDPSRGVLTLSLAGRFGRALAFDKRGESLFIGFSKGEVVSFDLQARRVNWSTRLRVSPLCLDTGAGHLAVGCADGRVRLFDASRGLVQSTLHIDATPVRALALDEGAKTLAVSGEGYRVTGEGHRVTFWSVSTGECLQVAQEHADEVRALAFDGRNGLWASGSRDTTVRVWDASFRQTQVLRGGVVNCVAFAADGRHLAAGYSDGSLILWMTPPRWEFDKRLTGHTKRINSLAFVHGAGTAGALVTGSEDGTLRVWDVATGRMQRTVGTGTTTITCVSTTQDGRYVASASADGAVRLYRWPLHPSLGEQPAAK